jgi:hypothetical protein
MKHFTLRLPVAAVLSAALLMGGCATPQSALDQANNAAMLTASLNAELVNFRKTQAAIAQARLDSVKRQRATMARYDTDARFEERVNSAAGATKGARLIGELRDLSDSRIKDEKDLRAALSELEVSFSKLLDPLPDESADVQATQKALAVMGEELSPTDRLKMAAAFASDVQKSVKANRDKIVAAQQQAASQPAPTQPAAPK